MLDYAATFFLLFFVTSSDKAIVVRSEIPDFSLRLYKNTLRRHYIKNNKFVSYNSLALLSSIKYDNQCLIYSTQFQVFRIPDQAKKPAKHLH